MLDFRWWKPCPKCGGFWPLAACPSHPCAFALAAGGLTFSRWNGTQGPGEISDPPPGIPQKHTSFLGNLLETTWKFTSFDHGISLGNPPESNKSATADFLSRLPLLLLLAQKLQISCLEEFVDVTSMVVFHNFFIRDIKDPKKGVCCYFMLITN